MNEGPPAGRSLVMGRRQIPSRGGSKSIAVQGHATLINDKSAFAEHWVSSLDLWFPEGFNVVARSSSRFTPREFVIGMAKMAAKFLCDGLI